LIDTGIFNDDRYFDVFVEYAKNSPDDLLIKITVFNRGGNDAELNLLPTMWFRNTWAWGHKLSATIFCMLKKIRSFFSAIMKLT
jgi:hypothetical protein